MYRELKKLGYSHITPRPQHYKQDNEKAETFKNEHFDRIFSLTKQDLGRVQKRDMACLKPENVHA
ncbi:MAG: winged helix-turn-helix domain-containing protein [Holosporaceae bacterium]|jgi:hypothetical protein|nr:winged helix-turn-helix domain-containing protein [Holosporaceae bacterium]